MIEYQGWGAVHDMPDGTVKMFGFSMTEEGATDLATEAVDHVNLSLRYISTPQRLADAQLLFDTVRIVPVTVWIDA